MSVIVVGPLRLILFHHGIQLCQLQLLFLSALFYSITGFSCVSYSCCSPPRYPFPSRDPVVSVIVVVPLRLILFHHGIQLCQL